MYILCEIFDDGIVLCDGCGSDIQEAAKDALDNLIHNFIDAIGWIDDRLMCQSKIMWQFTKVLPEKVKYVPPSWKPSNVYLEAVRDMTLQAGAELSARNQV